MIQSHANYKHPIKFQIERMTFTGKSLRWDNGGKAADNGCISSWLHRLTWQGITIITTHYCYEKKCHTIKRWIDYTLHSEGYVLANREPQGNGWYYVVYYNVSNPNHIFPVTWRIIITLSPFGSLICHCQRKHARPYCSDDPDHLQHIHKNSSSWVQK